MDKIFRDRLNHLKSQLKWLKGEKIIKSANESLILEQEGRIKELKALQALLKKKGKKR